MKTKFLVISLIVFLFLGAMSVSATPMFQGNNLFPNPSFEIPASNGTQPASWNSPCATTNWDATTAHSGMRSVKSTASCYWWIDVSTDPNLNYTFSVWHKDWSGCYTSSARLHYQLFTASGQSAGEQAVDFYCSFNWKQETVSFPLKDWDPLGIQPISRVRFRLTTSAPSGGWPDTIWWDDVEFSPPNDNTPPTVNWISPVTNQQVYSVSSGNVQLQISATDTSGVRSVEFKRWDAPNNRWISIATASSPPYVATLDVSTLNMGWNQVNADATDNASNVGSQYIWVNRTIPQKLWTVMVYLDSDNNLDDIYPGIFRQYTSTANNPNVNIVLAWDRSGNNKDAYYKVKYDTSATPWLNYTEGVDMWTQNPNELNSAIPTTLSSFITFARSNYPAQYYGLILSDHGTGLSGTLRDDTSGGVNLSVPNLASALNTATNNGANKIDVIFADSCLMAMVETGYEIRNYASYFVASENEIFFPRSNESAPYENYISTIGSGTTPQNWAGAIVAYYASWAIYYNNDPNNPLPYTISAVDLGQMSLLKASMQDLSNYLKAQLAAQPTLYGPKLLAARTAAQKFDCCGPNGSRYPDYVINQNDYYLDIFDFASQIQTQLPSDTAAGLAGSVKSYVSQYKIYESHKSGWYGKTKWNLDGSNGVSVFVPYRSSSFYPGLGLHFVSDTGWGLFITAYVQATNAFALDDPNAPDLVPPLNPNGPNSNIYLPFITK